jgi:hypothetical protein
MPHAAVRRRPKLARRGWSPPRLELLEDRCVPSVTPLVVASYFDSALYKIDANSGALLKTLVAPYSQSVLQGPAGMAVGPDGNLYLSSQFNDSIVEYNTTTHAMYTFIPSSVLDPIARVNGDSVFAPAGLRFGPDGNLYVSLNGGRTATSGGGVIRFDITKHSGVLAYSGTAVTITTGLIQPTEMTFGASAGNLDDLYVSNSGGASVIKIKHATSLAPQTTTFIAMDANGLNYPTGLTWGPDGKLYVVDLGATTTTHTGKILRYNVNGTFDTRFTKGTSLNSQFPSDAIFTPVGDLLTANLGPAYPPALLGSISEFNPDGTFNHTLDGSGLFPNTGPGTSGFSPAEFALYPGNKAPTARAGGPYSINVGASLVLNAGASSDPDGDPLTYSWVINGKHGSATGVHPSLTWTQLNDLGVTGPGTYFIRVEASDGHGQVVASSPVELTVSP